MLCRHCVKNRVLRPRGLCWRCYYRPGVRDLYPSTSKYAPGHEPSAEEVEATVEEQMKCLPAWWQSEAGRD